MLTTKTNEGMFIRSLGEKQNYRALEICNQAQIELARGEIIGNCVQKQEHIIMEDSVVKNLQPDKTHPI